MLVDSHRLVIDGWIAFAREHGREMSTDEVVARTFGRRTLDILVDVFGLSLAEAAEAVAAGVDDKSAEIGRAGGLPPVPGAPEFVHAALQAGIPSAVVSSAARGNIQLALAGIGLAGAFDVVVDHDRVTRGKPAPDPYLLAAVELGVPIGDCVVFEDTPPGLASGRAAGARCVGVASLGRPELLAGADLVIDDFRGLRPDDVLSRLDGPSRRAVPRGARCRGRSTAGGADARQR